MYYVVSGENNYGKWRIIRPNKETAQKTAERQRKIHNAKNVRVRKVLGKRPLYIK